MIRMRRSTTVVPKGKTADKSSPDDALPYAQTKRIKFLSVCIFVFMIYYVVSHIWKIRIILKFKSSENKNDDSGNSKDWCLSVRKARSNLMPMLHVKVPCESMKPAKSAIVCMLTDGVPDGNGTRIVFTATDYLNGALALGASLIDRIDHSTTHQLLLLREGFELAEKDKIALQSVGWIVGTAPNVPIQKRYLPRYPRYKTLYTKTTVIGLAEYECALLIDADTLAVGDLKDLMQCNIFTEPQHRVAGTLDLDSGRWYGFNTGSILWRPDSKEMERVFNLTTDLTFMRRYSSDQAFLNHVYPERLDKQINQQIINGKMKQIEGGKVVDMGWDYNAQTHVEPERSDWWENRRPTVRILHFTRKKGWQCEERHEPPIPLSKMPKKCNLDIPICYCRESHLYWNALSTANELTKTYVQNHPKR